MNHTPADPSACKVTVARDTSGAVACIGIILPPDRPMGATEYWGEDEVSRLIRLAREEEGSDPHSDRLPSDRAFICAALRDLGIPIQGEDDASWRDVVVTVRRLGEEAPFWTGPAGEMHDQNYEAPEAREAIRTVASGEADGCDIGSGAATRFVLTRADRPFSLDDHEDMLARLAREAHDEEAAEPAGTGMVAAFDALADASADELAEAEEEIAALRAQRDALLAAAKAMVEWEARMGGFEAPVWDALRAAIAQAEGR